MSSDGAVSEYSDLRPREKCGIIGCASEQPVATDLYYGETKSKRGMGLVHEVFTRDDLMAFRGRAGIGHVRYSTTGSSVLDNAQPIVVKTSYGDIALAHNGDIVNAAEIREDLSRKGWAFMTTSDSEVIIRLLANELVSSGDPRRALRDFTGRLQGAYSLALLINSTVYAVRDPFGIRPLCIGERDGTIMIASESVAFDALGYRFIRDLKAGEIIELRPGGFDSFRLPHPTHTAHCMFEWVYFARPDSVIDGRLVYDARVKIGQELAREHPVEADIVVPVPESGRAQAQGYAAVAGLPLVEGLIKNRYIERTFIMPEQSEREVGVMLKLNPIRSAVKNKRVVLIDDSIIRGTTLRKIVQIVRQAGAREVHVRIGCPPIRSPCFLGIDMKTREQFIANEKTVPEIGEFITADSIGYLSMRGLINALKHPRDDLCLGCLTGEYPIAIPGEKMRKEKPLEMFGEASRRKEPRKVPAKKH